MIKTILVEDSKDNRDALKQMLKKHADKVEIVGEADDIKTAREVISNLHPELIFMDISLSDGTAFDLLREFSTIDFKIIFITGYDSYAIQAIKYSALDYILKPVDPEELETALNKAEEVIVGSSEKSKIEALLANLVGKPSRLVIPTQDGIELIDTDEIVWLKAEKSYTRVFTTRGKTLFFSKNLKYFEGLLDDSAFFRVHHSAIICMYKVSRFLKQDGGMIKMCNQDTVPVSSRRKTEFLARLSMLME